MPWPIWILRLHSTNGTKQRLGLEDHTFSPSKRAVVNGTMFVKSEVSEIMDLDLDDLSLDGLGDNSKGEGT
jgi:hypothetical protein